MFDLPAITAQCGAEVYTEAIHRIISVESSFNLILTLHLRTAFVS